MKHEYAKRLTSLSLIGTIALSLLPVQAMAAAPSTQSDETLYLTLDAYGAPTESSVVKSYQLGDATSITDYGTYEQITNMTDSVKPEIGDGTVTFNFSENAVPSQFYFEGTLKDAPTTVLPWTVDIGYKLNGVAKSADELAGAEGLVEIDIHCKPNTGASTYFRNNMIMMLTAVIDRDSTLSLEAPGAQMQTLGSKQIAVFAVLPGEEDDFVLRIGSDDFAFTGLFGVMAPATLDQLSQIADLREAKDTIKDSADAASSSMDVILNTLRSLQSSLSITSEGLSQLDDARASINANKGSVQANADAAIADLGDLADSLDPMTGHLSTAQSAVNDMNDQLNEIVGTVSSLHTELAATRESIAAVQGDVDQISTMLTQLHGLSGFRNDLTQNLKDDTSELQDRMDDLSSSLSRLNNLLASLKTSIPSLTPLPVSELEQLQTLFATIEANYGASAATVIQTNYPQYAPYYPYYQNGQLAILISSVKTLNDTIAKINAIISQLNATVSSLNSSLQGSLGDLSDTVGIFGYDGLVDDLWDAADLLDRYMDIIEKNETNVQDLLLEMNKFGTTLSDTTIKLDTTLTQLSELQNILNAYEPDLQSSLEDCKTTISSVNSSLTSAQSFLASLRNLLRQNSNTLNSGTSLTLQGLVTGLNRAVAGLTQTGVLQDAKDTIKNTVDDKWDEYTGGESNILNIDSNAAAVSLTSSKNASPESIQVVFRTAEITTDDDDASTVEQDENWQAEGNIFTRIADIFKKIVNAVKSVFS